MQSSSTLALTVARALAMPCLQSAFDAIANSASAGPELYSLFLSTLAGSPAPRLADRESPELDASAATVAFISSASRCGAHQAASLAFAAALSEGERSCAVFNAYISACGRSGRVGEATAAFATMRAQQVPPTAVTFNALISVHATAGDVSAAGAVLESMRLSGFTPSQRSYGALLAAHAQSAAGADAVRACAVFDAAGAEGVALNAHMASSLLTSLARACGSPDRGFQPHDTLQRAQRVMAQLRAQGGAPNAACWSALLSAMGRAGAASEALEALAEAGPLAAQPYVLSAALNACRGSRPHALKALQLLRASPASSHTTEVLNTALHLMAVTLERGALAEQLLESMAIGARCPPDARSFEPLFAAAAQRRDEVTARRLLSRMEALRLTPSGRCLAALLSAVGRGPGGPEEAQRLCAHLLRRHAGLRKDEYVFSALLDAHVKAGDVDVAFELVQRMREEGVQPTAVTFAILLEGCKRTSDMARALAVAHQMAAAGLAPSDAACNLLIMACSQAGMLDEMLAEMRLLSRKGGQVERETLSAMLSALCRYQYAQRALRLRALMAARGVVPSASAFSALAEAAAREGLVAAAFDVTLDAQSHGVPLSPAARSAVVASLCRAGEVGQALWLACDEREAQTGATLSLPLHAHNAAAEASTAGPYTFEETTLSPSALATLCAACARVRRTATALTLYQLLLRRCRARAGAEAQPGAAMRQAGCSSAERLSVFSSMVEACLLSGRLREAVDVFVAAREDPEAPPTGRLALPTLCLASLEAACARSDSEELRLKRHEVCASLRISRAAEKERKLVRPPKQCHHFQKGRGEERRRGNKLE
jgi:pentatricopeptide repeat protein